MIGDTFLDALQNQVLVSFASNVDYPNISPEMNSDRARRPNGLLGSFNRRFIIGNGNFINQVDSIPETDEQEEVVTEPVGGVTSSFNRIGLPTIIEEPETPSADNNTNFFGDDNSGNVPADEKLNNEKTSKESDPVETDQENANDTPEK